MKRLSTLKVGEHKKTYLMSKFKEEDIMSREKNRYGLLPCPFCNNKEVRTLVGVGTGAKHNMVVCDKCSAIVSFEDEPQYLAMVRAWNRR